jgi:hypothetical protein
MPIQGSMREYRLFSDSDGLTLSDQIELIVCDMQLRTHLGSVNGHLELEHVYRKMQKLVKVEAGHDLFALDEFWLALRHGWGFDQIVGRLTVGRDPRAVLVSLLNDCPGLDRW